MSLHCALYDPLKLRWALGRTPGFRCELLPIIIAVAIIIDRRGGEERKGERRASRERGEEVRVIRGPRGDSRKQKVEEKRG